MNNAGTPETLQQVQLAFAAHIRNPHFMPAPAGIEDRRIQVYRELFFNNISKFLASHFPVLRKLCSDERWSSLVREFYIEHRAQTPLFTELPREFLRYLQEQRQDRDGDQPFLLELAHYESVELALSIAEKRLEDVEHDPHGDLLEGAPVLSPLAWPLSYRFPVHRIGPGYQPSEPPAEATHLLVYRNRSDEVKFILLNDVSRLLLALMQEQPDACGRDLLEQIAARIDASDVSVLVTAGTQLMKVLHSRDVILGTRPRTHPASSCTGI